MKKLAILFVAGLSLGGMAHGATTSQTVDLLQGGIDVGDVTLIRGGLSSAVRITVDDGLLTTGNIYQVLIRYYSKPQYCATPNACVGSVDLPARGGSTRIEASQFLVSAGEAKATGNLFFGRFYRAPEGTNSITQLIQGNGPEQMMSAQVQVELRNVGARENSAVVFDQLTDFTVDDTCGVSRTCNTFAESDLITAP